MATIGTGSVLTMQWRNKAGLQCRIKVGGVEGNRNALDSISFRGDLQVAVAAQVDSQDPKEEADGVAEVEVEAEVEATSAVVVADGVVEVGAVFEL